MDIILTVECGAPDSEEAAKAAERLRERLMVLVPEIKVGLDVGFMRNYEIRVSPLGSLPRNPITGKIKKIVDNRVK